MQTSSRLPRFLAALALGLALCLSFLPCLHGAQAAEESDGQASERSAAALKRLLGSMNPQTGGTVTLQGGLAAIVLPPGIQYLNPKDTRTMLVNIWGNPPQSAEHTLGMLVKSPADAVSEEGWGIVITYSDDGHVSDKDAAKIDYNKMLRDIQRSIEKDNKAREKEGYAAYHLIGWAEPPHYDSEAKKIYWAKELAFGGNDAHTLNYCVRILGREGVLELNAVAPVSQLAVLRGEAQKALAGVEFNEGHRYADYNASTDRAAEYGLAALVAGGVAAKTGLLKGLFALLLAAKKFLIVAVIGLIAVVKGFFKRIAFGKRKSPQEELLAHADQARTLSDGERKD